MYLRIDGADKSNISCVLASGCVYRYATRIVLSVCSVYLIVFLWTVFFCRSRNIKGFFCHSLIFSVGNALVTPLVLWVSIGGGDCLLSGDPSAVNWRLL